MLFSAASAAARVVGIEVGIAVVRLVVVGVFGVPGQLVWVGIALGVVVGLGARGRRSRLLRRRRIARRLLRRRLLLLRRCGIGLSCSC